MPKIIKDNAIVSDHWQLIEALDGALPEGAIIVPLQRWLNERDSLQQREQIGVWLDSDQPPAALLDSLDTLPLIAIRFPVFMDGRGFSYARELRQNHGYQGELRAIGNIFRDQLFFLKRCGFNAYALEGDLESACASLQDFSDSYQHGVENASPLLFRR